MSAQWVSAVASLATFVVIGASAVAALLQLRHMRGGNQIAALLECRERLESQEFREAQRFVIHELPKRLEDPNERRKISEPRSQADNEYRAIHTVANLFESLGAFVKHRIIDGNVTCDIWGNVVRRNWAVLAPVIAYQRQIGAGPRIWENFEFLAMLATRYKLRHAAGTYPRRMLRMPEDRSFIDALRADSPPQDTPRPE